MHICDINIYARTSRGSTPMMFHVVLKKDEEGWIVAECPALPGCFSQGKTEQEALANIKEAITAWLWAEDQKAAEALPEGEAPLVVAV
jgi:predicted RNase H-like HicB family nuclease